VLGGGGRDFYHLSVEPLHQRSVLRFGITDDDIILGEQKAVGNLPFGGKALAGTRCAENQAVGIFQELPVHHDEVVGQGVDAVVQRLLAALEQLLRSERNKDGSGTGGQPPLDLDL